MPGLTLAPAPSGSTRGSSELSDDDAQTDGEKYSWLCLGGIGLA